jgi:hypothetical protein
VQADLDLCGVAVEAARPLPVLVSHIRLKTHEKLITGGIFFVLFSLYVPFCSQHSFNCRPSDSTVSEDAGIEPRTVATSALAVRRSNH